MKIPSAILTIAIGLFTIAAGFAAEALAQVIPNDPGFGNQYGLHNTGQTVGPAGSQIVGVADEDIDAPEAWRLKTDASDVIVAVIDLGIGYNHPDLAANLWVNPGEIAGNGIDDDQNGYVDDINGWDFLGVDNDPSGTSWDAHGAVSAGVIGAVGNNGIGVTGVAWNVKLMMLGAYGAGGVAAAIRYATNNGAKVINHTSVAPTEAISPTVVSALAYAGAHEVLYITPATSSNTNNDNLFPCNSIEPNVVCVTASNAQDSGVAGHGLNSVDIVAPGNRIYSTIPPNLYGWSSGTSHSGPYVAGAAALIYSQKPGISAVQVKQILLSTVDPSWMYRVNGPTPIATGGRLNLARALNSPIGAPQGFSTRVAGPNYSDQQGWSSSPAYYETIRTADVNGDGKADVCARGNNRTECMMSTGTGFSHWTLGPVWSNANGWLAPDKYRTIQYADVDADGKADMCGRGAGGLECWLFNGSAFATMVGESGLSDALGWHTSPAYYKTIKLADLSGDGKADVCFRGAGSLQCLLSDGTEFPMFVSGPVWSDAAGWSAPDKYLTIQFADVNGDGRADICGRGAAGFECWLSNGVGFPTKVDGPVYSDAQGWASSPAYYETIKMADINGDSMADVCARGISGMTCMLSTGTGFSNFFEGPRWSDGNGWSAPDKYKTIQLADINGDAMADICGRSAAGYECWLSNGTAFATPLAGPPWTDAASWNLPQYYSTINLADVNADQKKDVCGRTASGYECWLAN